MKKVLALVLAAAMMLTLGVGALADETASGIVTYGGGGDEYSTDGYVVAEKGAFDPSDVYTFDEMMSASKNLPDLHVGETLELAVYAYERNIEEDEITFVRHTAKINWEAKNPKIATISNDGVVTAVSTNGAKDGIAMAEFEAVVPARAGKWSYDRDYYIGYNYIRVLAEDVTEDDFIGGYFTVEPIFPGVEPTFDTPDVDLYIGETAQYGVFQYEIIQTGEASFETTPIRPYNGDVVWEVDQETITGIISISDTGLVTALGFSDKFLGNEALVRIVATIPAAKTKAVAFVNVKKGTNPNPSNPTNPTDPTRPSVVDSGSREDKAPEATQNAANDDKTTDALRKGEAVEVKVSNGSSALSTETANLLGGASGKLTLQNGGMTVVLPGGFGKVTEAGRVYYPFDFEQNPARAAEILSGVKGNGAKSEAVKAGGVMTLPATATVTLKTKLTGTVNVYWYNEDTKRYTLVASPTVTENGTITFPTRQMGYFLLTTGRI